MTRHGGDGLWVLGRAVGGERVDAALAAWHGVSRRAAWRLLDAGAVRLNDTRTLRLADKGLLLDPGDVLSLLPGYDETEAPRPDPALPLDVVTHGGGWLAVNKPAGVPVRPHKLDETGTVINAVAARYPQVVGVGEGGLRSGVVHRLDNDTSGVLLVALDQAVWSRLRGAFADHRVRKRYRALVHGLPDDAGESVRHLRVQRQHEAVVTVHTKPTGDGDSRRCSLSWRVVERFGDAATLIEVDLHTGFLHQVRAMMADLGHPVIGDAAYGAGRPTYDAARQMLHAASVQVDDLAASAPLPEDFEQTIARLRQTKQQP